jgi:hypothetical protein
MKTTYLVENVFGEVIEYCTRLYDAKNILEYNKISGIITKLRGQYFGEGYHHYYLKYDGKKFKKVQKV